MNQIFKGIFVTGTDTGVGKTVVSAALLSLMRAEGIDAVPMKPVQTGCIRKGGQLQAPDLEFCLRMAGVSASDADKRRMAPYCFEKPCSPHLAAVALKQRIEIEPIRESFQALYREHPVVIVEGAGGVLVPLNENQFMVDLMAALALPVVLVVRPGLGTINHTLLSLRELICAGLSVAGVIVNETGLTHWGEIEDDNIAALERLGRVRVLGRLPFMSPLDPAALHSIGARHLPVVSEWIRMA